MSDGNTFTLVVQVGNTDGRLVQSAWSDLCADVRDILEELGKLYFYGGSNFDAPWQNACFVCSLDSALRLEALSRLRVVSKSYKTSVVVTSGRAHPVV